mmetsp:Transcript_1459/g.3126  ORF Transcript_1459/g.3126 Transcript_1459/m.3126 type:complete len:250 (-) Transcript_1459:1396-2145(-)
MPCWGTAPCKTRSENLVCSRHLHPCTTGGNSCQEQRTQRKAAGGVLRRRQAGPRSCPDAQMRPSLGIVTPSTASTLLSTRQTESRSTDHWRHTSRRKLAHPDAARQHPSRPNSCMPTQSTHCAVPRCSSETRCPSTADPRIPDMSLPRRTLQHQCWPGPRCSPGPILHECRSTVDLAVAMHSPWPPCRPTASVSQRQNSSPNPRAPSWVRKDGTSIHHRNCSKILGNEHSPCCRTTGSHHTLPPFSRKG